MSDLNAKEVAAVRKLLTFLSETETEPGEDVADLEPFEKVDIIVDRVAALEDRVHQLEDVTETLQERVPERGTDEKIADLVRYAANRREGEDIVAVTRDELKALWGCSRRYSYTLCNEEDGLSTEKEWLLSSKELQQGQFGNAEIDHGDTRTKRVGVDFAGVHSEGVPMNRFITEHEKEGATE